jgi:hypothetical protein
MEDLDRPCGSERPDTIRSEAERDSADVSAPARTFGLSSLLLVIAVLGLSFGVMRKSLGLGIPLAFILTPACVRACRAAALRRAQGQPMGAVEAAHAFLGSIGVMTAVGTAAVAGFVGTCMPIGIVMAVINMNAIWIAGLIGGVAGLYAGYLSLLRLWPCKG